MADQTPATNGRALVGCTQLGALMKCTPPFPRWRRAPLPGPYFTVQYPTVHPTVQYSTELSFLSTMELLLGPIQCSLRNHAWLSVGHNCVSSAASMAS